MQNATAQRGTGSVLARLVAALVALFAVMTLVGLTASPAAAQQGYRLRSGDILRVEVLEDANLNRSLLVAPDGRVTLPLAGAIAAGGHTVEQVQADLTARLAPNFASQPTVFVSLEKLADQTGGGGGTSGKAATMSIYVMGEAAKPGRLDVEPRATVLQAFAQMGGFTKFAAQKRIQLRRDGKTYDLDYKAIEAGSSSAGNMQLKDGDVIIVPQRHLFE